MTTRAHLFREPTAAPRRVGRRCTPGGAFVEHVGSDDAVVAEALDTEQASVGSEADLLQILEIAQPEAPPVFLDTDY